MGNYTYQHDPRISGADFEDDTETKELFNSADDLPWETSPEWARAVPYYKSNLGDCYCAECDCHLAGGPHSPNPHDEKCQYWHTWEDED